MVPSGLDDVHRPVLFGHSPARGSANGSRTATPPASHRGTGSSPWVLQEGVDQPNGYDYGKTALADGTIPCLVDCAAHANVAGKEALMQLAEAAARHGRETKSKPLENPLKVSGVGDGTQDCPWERRVPVAVPTADGKAVPLT